MPRHFLYFLFLIPPPVLIQAPTPSLAETTSFQNYFPQNYTDARERVRRYIDDLIQKNKDSIILQQKVPSQIDQDLTVDGLYLPASKEKKKLLVLSSGIHGIEAFMGSAVQFYFLNELLSTTELSEMGVLLIHSVNPFGYKYLRRVTENNVDLNRNMSLSRKLFELKNPGYQKVEELLNPKNSVNLSSFNYYFSFIEIIYSIIEHSMKSLRQAVLQGQYEFERGLYFGGNDFEPQRHYIKKIFEKHSAPYKHILAIDLHTGFGKRGRLHLFGSHQKNQKTKELTAKVFDGFKIDTGNDEDFYSVHGDFTAFLGQLTSKEQIYIPMTFEYGTLDSQEVLGSIKSITRMIRENQGYHYGFARMTDKAKVNTDFKEMFLPSSKKWREQVIIQTKKILPTAIRNFQEL